MTELKNDLYPKAYGQWAGRRAPDYTRCCETVHSRGRWATSSQCSRPRGHGPDEAYCKQHDPDRVAKKRAAREAEWDAQATTRRKRWRLEAMAPKLVDALRQIEAGHNDPRTLANEVLKELDNG